MRGDLNNTPSLHAWTYRTMQWCFRIPPAGCHDSL